jgi:MEDS: MEthanogen/methylotroph, DcmR Sensory domain
MRVDAHTLAVDQVRLGDHAFFSYADGDARWEVAAAFAGIGHAAGDKVIIVPDPAVSGPDAGDRIAALDGTLDQALADGHVICASMREIISPDRRFSPPRQLVRLRDAAGQARRDGYGGLRLFVDMTWTHDLGVDAESMMAWESGAHELFGSGEFAAICSYDRHAFAPPVVEAMWAGHPLALLDRPGALRGYRSALGCHLIGDADIATRASFMAAITAALDVDPGCVLLDLSRLCFLSVGCASDLLRLVAAAHCGQVVVRCSGAQARLLRRLDSASLPALALEQVADLR